MKTGITPRTATSILLLAALVTGCSEAPAGPEVPPQPELTHVPALAPGLGDLVPFHLEASAKLLSQVFAPDFGYPEFGKSDFDGRCSTPSDLLLSFGLSGQATHLGSFTGTVEHCTQIDFRTGAPNVTDGIMKLTSADGDELMATYVGQPGPNGLEEYVTFVGGTGRFATATGSAVSWPICDQSTGACTLVTDGVIGYDASDTAGW